MPASHSIEMSGSAPAAPRYYSIHAGGQTQGRATAPRTATAVALLVTAAALALLLTPGVFPSGAPKASSALYVTVNDVADDLADTGRDVVAWQAPNVRWLGRRLRGVGRKARGAVRSLFRQGNDDVQAAADAAAAAAGRAARRADDKFHDAARKAE